MKKASLIIVLWLLGQVAAPGRDDDILTMDDVLQSAQDWATNNLDEDALRVLQEIDQKKVKDFLVLIQKELQGEYVVDLAPLREAAKVILPILESHDETQAYGIWLKTRLDYLDVAEELRLTIPPPKAEPGQAPPPMPNPRPQQARDIWIKEISQKPPPKATNPLVAELKPVFAEEKIPPQLVWIAEVESSFDSRARSPAGAAGLFQLMPAAAKRFGLRTWPLDQRLNSKESARAAAKYLSQLHSQFKDWRLALAAYNSGEGTVRKLLDRRKAKTYDAIATRLPAETQMYVPKVEAVLRKRESVKLDELPPS